ncbi:hypothetical protein L9F63_018081, partial [Diploptera punctata]
FQFSSYLLRCSGDEMILDFPLSILANVLDPPYVLVFDRKFVCWGILSLAHLSKLEMQLNVGAHNITLSSRG